MPNAKYEIQNANTKWEMQNTNTYIFEYLQEFHSAFEKWDSALTAPNIYTNPNNYHLHVIGTYNLSENSKTSIFLNTYSRSGNLIRRISIGSTTSNQEAWDITTDDENNIYITGQTFGNFAEEGYLPGTQYAGLGDVFLTIKWDLCDKKH